MKSFLFLEFGNRSICFRVLEGVIGVFCVVGIV